jgi:sugar phosphate isomerase/epimerase
MQNQLATAVGIVSNCWKMQLDQGQSLAQLIDEASKRGFRAIELRQGCLGEFEGEIAIAGSSLAAQSRLKKLRDEFDVIEFNLAIDVPFFSRDRQLDNGSFYAAVQAARCLARDGSPHLRLVDTQTRQRDQDNNAINATALILAELASRLIMENGRLSVEHAYQSWHVFQSTLNQARHKLGTDADRLRCCFDPCNLLLTETPADVLAIVKSIIPSEVSMIHVKQRRDGSIQPDVSEGDLAWSALIESLIAEGHRGPWLFEVAPHENVWDNLEKSRHVIPR